jgi:outer membrane immunogenic protein
MQPALEANSPQLGLRWMELEGLAFMGVIDVIQKSSSAIAVAMALFTGTALAADLPSRKGLPPIYFPPPPPLWTGLYSGLNAGGVFGGSDSVDTATLPIFPNGVIAARATLKRAGLASASIPVDDGGFIGGGQIGYNWQFGRSFVAGVETDIQGVAGSGGAKAATTFGVVAVPVISTLSSTRSLDYLGTLRGRLGWSFTPTLLAYGTGGLAYGGVSSHTSILQLGLTNGLAGVGGDGFSDTRAGWTAGGGVEWMFLPNWSAKAEYLHYDLGSVSSSGALISGGAAAATLYAAPQSTTRFNGNVARAGLSYHFSWGYVPVMAAY